MPHNLQKATRRIPANRDAGKQRLTLVSPPRHARNPQLKTKNRNDLDRLPRAIVFPQRRIDANVEKEVGIRLTNSITTEGHQVKQLLITNSCFSRLISMEQTPHGVLFIGEFEDDKLRLVIDGETELLVGRNVETEDPWVDVVNQHQLQQHLPPPEDMVDDEETLRGYEGISRDQFELDLPVRETSPIPQEPRIFDNSMMSGEIEEPVARINPTAPQNHRFEQAASEDADDWMRDEPTLPTDSLPRHLPIDPVYPGTPTSAGLGPIRRAMKVSTEVRKASSPIARKNPDRQARQRKIDRYVDPAPIRSSSRRAPSKNPSSSRRQQVCEIAPIAPKPKTIIVKRRGAGKQPQLQSISLASVKIQTRTIEDCRNIVGKISQELDSRDYRDGLDYTLKLSKIKKLISRHDPNDDALIVKIRKNLVALCAKMGISSQ